MSRADEFLLGSSLSQKYKKLTLDENGNINQIFSKRQENASHRHQGKIELEISDSDVDVTLS